MGSSLDAVDDKVPEYDSSMHDPGTDPRSELVTKILASATYEALVPQDGPTEAGRDLLRGATPEQLLIVPLADVAAGYAMLAGLWLWVDGLHESHEIAQKSPADLAARPRGPSLKMMTDKSSGEDLTSTLSFWHAIMHRREGDFWNSKYWYDRCRNHPALAAIGANASAIVNPLPADKPLLRLTVNGWDPAAFVDLVEIVHRNPSDPPNPPDPPDPRHRVAVALQQLEWRMLFDHCTRLAAGR